MMIIFKNWLSKHWHWLLLALVSVCFFIGTASYNYYAQPVNFIKWSSPDESANYNFAKLYAQEGRLSFFEKYNLLADDIIHPRSYLSVQGVIRPISFLGLILIYGKIASLTSYKILPYLTPLFAAIGIIFYFLLIKEVFGKRNALISALILAGFPPYIYYSARSLFHNVLFVVLLLISFYFAVIMVKRKKAEQPSEDKVKNMEIINLVYAAIGGGFMGLAIITRPAELIWLAPAGLILWLFNFKKIGFIKLMIFLACLLFALLPAIYWNRILFGSYWQGGYNEMNQSILNITSAGGNIIMSAAVKTAAIKANLHIIKDNFFHFGFWPVKSFKMLYFYFAKMFYWLFWPAVLGFFWFVAKIKKWKRRHWAYLSAYAICFFILLFYYGSWDFHDNPDPASRTIGNSYTRYWLPIYLGVIPLASFFFIRLTGLLRKKVLINAARTLIIMVIFFVAIKFVVAGSAEGLSQSVKKQLASRAEFNRVMELTEARAVIITQYHDKLFFPERKVIVGLFNDDNMIKQYAVLVKYLPVYYYNFTFPEKDINYLNNKRLPGFSLQISPVAQVTKDFTLYKLGSFIKPADENSLNPNAQAPMTNKISNPKPKL